MLLVQQVTSNPLQKQNLILPNGNTLELVIYFRPQQVGWFVNDLIYGEFVLHGLRITNSPNMLNQWRNLIPFGLGCFSTANREPSQAEDFSSGASKLYVLTEVEVTEYAEFLAGG